MAVCYHHFLALFDDRTLAWLLESALDRSTLVKLCNRCDVKYNGVAAKSVASHVLANDLSRQFFDRKVTAEIAIRFLSQLYFPEIEAFGINSSTFDEYGATSDSSLALRQLCRLILTLGWQESQEAHAAIPRLVARAQAIAAAAHVRRDVQPTAPADKPSNTAMAIVGHDPAPGITGIQRERFDQQNVGKEAERAAVQDQATVLQLELDSLRHRHSVLEKTLADKADELDRLRGELAEMSRRTGQIIPHDDESRKLQYSVDTEASTGVIHAIEQLVTKGIHETHDIVTAMGEHILAEYTALRLLMDEFQKDLQTLRIESQRENHAGRSPRPAQREHERVGIFVDVQNMFYAARLYDARLDFEKLMHAAVGGRRMIRAMAYLVQTPEVDQSGFVAMLQQRSYQVKRKDLRQRSDGSAKGDWDMGMAIDIIGLADKLDVVVLVSGDGDFVSLVHLLKEIGPSVEVFSFPHNTARDLIEAADRYVPIDESLLMKLDRSTVSTERQPEQTAITVP